MGTRQKIAFDQFLGLATSQIQPDYSAQVKTSPVTVWKIPEKYGVGRITISPLMGGAGLVVMESCFHQDIEVFTEQTMQKNLSFTVCLQGGIVNCCQHKADVNVASGETLFARFNDKQPRMSSYFNAGEQSCFITIQLSSDWLCSTEESLQSDILTDPFWQGVFNSGKASQMMLTVAREIVNVVHQADFQHHYLSAKVLELWSHQIVLLRRLLPSSKQQLKLKAQDIARIHQAADILINEMVSPPSLLELAHKVGINDNKLKIVFKQVYGMTVFSFLQQQRLKKAKLLLSEQPCNVTQAA